MTTTDPLPLEHQRLQSELAQARAALEDFTHSVSHDLRAPLRHVNAYVQILQEDMAELGRPDLLAHLETVSQAARQMGRQIDALLELSRLNRADLQCARFDAGALVRDVCATLTTTLNGRSLEWTVAPDLPALQGDAALIRQALVHLLSNAVKFSAPRALAKVEVTWQARPDGWCALTVGDNGVGFNPQYGGKLFQAFARLHPLRQFEGLGMGLALTRRIVERHGGAIWADGVPDGGCRVSLTLPLA